MSAVEHGDAELRVTAALAREGLQARAMQRITVMRVSAAWRSAWRVDLEDGRVVKVRTCLDAESARQHAQLRAVLPADFAPVLTVSEDVLIEAWIHGRVLDEPQPDRARVARAGELLAEVHDLRWRPAPPGGQPAGTPLGSEASIEVSTGEWRDETEQGLAWLRAAGLLSADQTAELLSRVAAHDPGVAAKGLIHRDYCGENMVVDEHGDLHVIDNEHVRWEFLGFDLGQAWSRWNLPSSLWECFLEAYGAATVAREARAACQFWRVAAVVKSARIRMRYDAASARVPVDRLQALAASRIST